ncbi:hypothetical protein A2886_03535 [candidate division WWE3 bacterium RIFCSPHIGHO2_01_FULL_42_13]|uniref:EfeO-type cupredoxin-like domain-containing protein n=1 Tax=candidate division WWE3 bacterium RIFCSPHIGHO2_01_FULL_42_13 TaxID=1802617 RepID=A0A1F4UR81_UNCKA|nr:MAG: hypothetical protein A2886_03535 [candidate division WWE3 bacterium RIFCSPHIGHO2_01_FULL_42_13]
MSKFLWVIAALAILGGGVYLYTNSQANMPQTTPVTEESQEMTVADTKDEDVKEEATVEVSYTDAGFEPVTVEVEPGTTVTFVNNSSGLMWVASDVHPTHDELPGFDQLEGGEADTKYNFTFTAVGEWGYHNHLFPSDTGTIVVVEAAEDTDATLDVNVNTETNTTVTY